jgi:DNA modification methylase
MLPAMPKDQNAKLMNTLHYGDNIDILRERIASASVHLVYLDPPFNSNRTYNVLFREKSGTEAAAQIEAFDDTWTWSYESEQLYQELISSASTRVADALEAMRRLLGDNDVLAYLVMMAARLIELHRVLTSTGSLYLHCDPTASHYLKILLDAIFGPRCFRNEIVWRRTGAHGKVSRFSPVHDILLFYTKSESKDGYVWNGSTHPYMRGHVDQYLVKDEGGWRTNYYGNVLTGSGTRGGESGKQWRGFDPTSKGRHWAIPGQVVEDSGEDLSGLSQHAKLDRLYELGHITIEPGATWPLYQHYVDPAHGAAASDIWAYQPYTEGTVYGTNAGIDHEARWLSPRDKERLGYQTQKPLGLIERIIRASSSKGDVVLDPFCGCGTAVDAAQKLGRRWIGIDITTIAVDLIDARLRHTYGESIREAYEILGIPRDMAGARTLFARSPFEFERWAIMMVDGQPNQKQVGDKGIDGVIRFPIDGKKNTAQALVSVKGGATGPAHVRELRGTVENRAYAEMGVFVCMQTPTKGMLDGANHSGFYRHPRDGKSYPVLQIITVEDLLAGKLPNLPATLLPYFQAERRPGPAVQYGLFDDS